MSRKRLQKCIVIAGLIIVLLFLLSELLRPTDDYKTEDDWHPVAVEKLRCLSGVVTVAPGGRTGNQIMEYASAWSLAEQYGLRLAAPTDLLTKLKRVFEGLSATPLADLLQHPSCKAHHLDEAKVLSYAVKDSLLYPVSRYVQWALSQGQPIILRECSVHPEAIAAMSGKLHQEFRYRRKHTKAAERTLTHVQHSAAQNASSRYSKVLIISIHARRGDYHPYLRRRYNASHWAGVGYYRRAAERMRKLLEPERVALAFIAASDDTNWCRKRLLPALKRDFQEGSPPSSVFLMSDYSRSPVHDLVALSASDHSVVSYGTFGTWGALMAGGRTIVFDLAATNPYLRNRSSAMHFAAHLPSWELLA